MSRPGDQSKHRSEYADRLKDPRWQKKRLEVFQRDNFTCRSCAAKDATLAVHHTFYKRSTMPWDYPAGSLLTLCEDCHSLEREAREELERNLLAVLRKNGILVKHLEQLLDGFSERRVDLEPGIELIFQILCCEGFADKVIARLDEEFLAGTGQTWAAFNGLAHD